MPRRFEAVEKVSEDGSGSGGSGQGAESGYDLQTVQKDLSARVLAFFNPKEGRGGSSQTHDNHPQLPKNYPQLRDLQQDERAD